jgi:predicted nucleic acid-binding Zn finger protein
LVHEELLVLERILDEIKSDRTLSRSNWERLKRVFDDRFDKAWRLVQEHRIKKYTFYPSKRVVWIAIGQGAEYQILPKAGYCSCDDFYFRVIDGNTGACYHLIAQKIATALNSFDEVKEEDEFYDFLMKEWRTQTLEDELP